MRRYHHQTCMCAGWRRKESLTLQNAYNDYGSAIYNEAALLVKGCTFQNNVAGFDGGAIYSTKGATMRVEDSAFNENTAYNGGAIYSENGMQLDSCLFDKNQSYNKGGAVYNGGGHAIINSSHFSNNQEHNIAASYQIDAATANVQMHPIPFNATVRDDKVTRKGSVEVFACHDMMCIS